MVTKIVAIKQMIDYTAKSAAVPRGLQIAFTVLLVLVLIGGFNWLLFGLFRCISYDQIRETPIEDGFAWLEDLAGKKAAFWTQNSLYIAVGVASLLAFGISLTGVETRSVYRTDMRVSYV